MSLQNAAKYLAKNGRGKDTMLVHMTPKEVGSLQALARANGGSLSVNPHTGLPEAGFLDSLLPVIIGGGLMAATGGAAAPLIGGMSMPAAIGLGVGGIQALRTGDIGKGITAGLGAYGGAGLAGGLGALGASQAADAASAGMPGLGSNTMTQAQADAIASARSGAIANAQASPFSTMLEGAKAGISDPSKLLSMDTGMGLTKTALAASAPFVSDANQFEMPQSKGSGPNPFKYRYEPNVTSPFPIPDVPGYGDQGRNFGREQRYYSGQYVPVMAGGGPVEAMSNANAVGANTGYPMANIRHGAYATPYQQPISQNVVAGDQDSRVDPYTGQDQFAAGGLSHLGDYSDGGRLLRGPGDGVSDSIPATIGDRQPARLADGEFVVPARIVSELGNGSTEAGARKLYAMMDRVQKARGKTTGRGNIAKNTRADKHLPA